MTEREPPVQVSDLLRWAIRLLSSGPTDTPRLDAEVMLGFILGKSTVQLVTSGKEVVSPKNRKDFSEVLERRRKGEPVAYLVGSKEFFGRVFSVDSAVLIPRPDTEILVEAALNCFPPKRNEAMRVLDIGTGSGAIGLTIAAERPTWEVECWDISNRALAVASRNAEALGLKGVKFKLCDALNPGSWSESRRRSPGGFHLICSNPPYISHEERPSVAPGILDFEPGVALFCPTGLEFYRAIAYLGRDLAAPAARIFCEIGWTQAIDVVAIFREQEWQDVAVIKDLAGKDRVVVASAPQI